MKIEASGSDGPLTVKCSLSLINTEGEDCFKRTITNLQSIPRFISHEELTADASKLLSEGQLSVSCTYEQGLKTHSQLLRKRSTASRAKKYVYCPGEDLLSLLADHPDEDAAYPHMVWLQLADGTLRTFSFPLAASSEAFRAMFRRDPKTTYSFPEISLKTGEDLLFYLYNGRMKEEADVKELLVVADKFLIGSLKNACVRILKRSVIDDDNWKEFFQLGNLCHVDQLKQLGMEHFKKFGRRIVKKPGWNDELSKADHAALIELRLC